MAKIRTRARAVDMLGRQQIATIQNAIAELFKNAYDAYAPRVQVDYLKGLGADGNGALLVRDNGFGMTREDFEGKWLVLGTESKVRSDNSDPGYVPPGQVPRKITGEKGIGRLAIALLGRQVVVFTRAKRYDKFYDLVVAWIHWELFEIPGLNLDDVEFPVCTFPGGTLPDRTALDGIRQEFIKDIKSCPAWNLDRERCERIVEEIKSFNPVLKEVDEFFRKSKEDNELSLVGEGCGTTFLIDRINPSIPVELTAEDKEQDSSFRQLLLGFVDHVFGSQSVDFQVSFKVWEKESFSGTEYLGAETFFTRKELDDCTDHFFSGNVDEYGQCRGVLRVYEERYDNVIIPWKNMSGRPTGCGPFRVLFGALQGRASESLVAQRSSQAFSDMNEKLDKLGGMYMYRDGIRILPYGLNDFDWLEIEKHRNLGARYYFFSYRRMIGAVLLSNPANIALQEKAGREGLQKNVPYQQLRAIMMNLLNQLVAEFFRPKGTNTGLFEQRKAELVKESEAYEKKLKQSRIRREKFADALVVAFKKFESGDAEKSTSQLLQKLEEEMRQAASLDNPDEAAVRLVSIEQNSLQALEAIREAFTVRRPMGVGLPKRLQEDWQTYQSEFKNLEEKILQPCQQEISRRIGEVAKQAKLYIDQRKRLQQHLESLARQRRKLLKESSDGARQNAEAAKQAVLTITDKAKRALEEVILNIQTEMNSTPLQDLSEAEVEKLRQKWESRLSQIEADHQRGVDTAKEMLSSLTDALAESDGESAALAASAMEKRVLDLEEQADQDFEMVQLGVAIAIINHEFVSATKQIRVGLRNLRAIAQRAPAVQPTYEQIQANFEHLDGYLKLFTPLQKRMYRKKSVVSGLDLKGYADSVFSARFVRHDVALNSTSDFDKFVLECYPSTIYPVIINLVDNAVHWLSTLQIDRKILLDARPDCLIVANNGPKIDRRDLDRIFERGFTRKPGGRGLGLYISTKALEQEGMTISVVPPPEGFTAAFGIFKPVQQEGADNDNP